LGKVSTTKVGLEFSKDCGKRWGLYMLGSINTESTETNTEKVCEIGSNTLTNVFGLCVKIRKAAQPSIV